MRTSPSFLTTSRLSFFASAATRPASASPLGATAAAAGATFGAGAAVRGDCGLLCWDAQPETIIAVVRQKVRNLVLGF